MRAPVGSQRGFWETPGFLAVLINNNTQYAVDVAVDRAPTAGSSGTYTVGAGRTVRLGDPFTGRFLQYLYHATPDPSAAVPSSPQTDFFMSQQPTDYSDVPIAGAVAASPVNSGVILLIGVTSAPTGWLACDGSAVSRTTYSALFAALGTAFGAGDGSTTFNLPNLTGSGLFVGGSVVAQYYVKT